MQAFFRTCYRPVFASNKARISELAKFFCDAREAKFTEMRLRSVRNPGHLNMTNPPNISAQIHHDIAMQNLLVVQIKL